MTVESNIEKDVVAHPMPGWVAIIPITDPSVEKDEEDIPTVISTPLGLIPAISLSSILNKGDNDNLVLAGIVVELHEDCHLPFHPNETKVFFWADRGVTIGVRTFILESSVICYA